MEDLKNLKNRAIAVIARDRVIGKPEDRGDAGDLLVTSAFAINGTRCTWQGTPPLDTVSPSSVGEA